MNLTQGSGFFLLSAALATARLLRIQINRLGKRRISVTECFTDVPDITPGFIW